MNKYWWKEDDGMYRSIFANNHEHYGNYLYLYKDYEEHLLNSIINLEKVCFVHIVWNVDDYPIE